MKLLFASNYPDAPTGYGSQTAQVVRRMKTHGIDVAVAANYGLAGREAVWHDIPVYPQSYDAYGNDVIPAHLADWADGQPAWIVTLFDVWPYARERFDKLPVASWTPVDHLPAPPKVIDWCREHRTIAMSRFGQTQLAIGGVQAAYIPHAYEPGIYYPRDRDAVRKYKGWDGSFIVTINAANKGNSPSRKAWNEMFGALSVFMKAHDDVLAYVHTEIDGFQSPSLGYLATLWGMSADRLLFAPQYKYKTGRFSPDYLAEIYTGSDVLLASSMGEGFGVPTIEAQACGTPVIVTDFAASTELVGPGWLVDWQPYFDAAQGATLATPLIPSIHRALEAAYEARDDQGIRDRAVAFAQPYNADTVFAEGWVPYLAELQGEIDNALAKPTRQQRRSKAKVAR